MPTTNLPPSVNTFNNSLRTAIDQRFVTETANTTLNVPDPGSPSQFVVEAVSAYQASLDGFENTLSLYQQTTEAALQTLAPKASPTLTGTPTTPTAVQGTSNTVIASTAFVQQAITDQLSGLGSIVPIGTISMWSGTLASVPAGWQVCDGTNGTPDLRNKFVVGAGNTYSVGATGGSANSVVVDHNHAASSSFSGSALDAHGHSVSDPTHQHATGNGAESGLNNIYGDIGGTGTGWRIANAGGDGRNALTNFASTGVTVNSASAGTPSGTVSTTVANTGSSATDANLPPYYAIFYIMKMANIVTPPAAAPLFADTTNNRIGINIANPSTTLHVGGNTTIVGFANVSSTLQTGGLATLQTVSAGNSQITSLGIGTAASGTTGEIRATNNITAYYSDDRLKTRLGAIENALDKIDQLSGFYYEANELAQSLGYEKVREVAVSAQDTQKVLPEIVAPAPIDSRYLTVRYEKFAPLLIEGIKELRVEINNIKKHLGI